MPSWGDLLNDQQIWQTVAFLKHVDQKNLPAEVQQELNSSKSRQ
jgi:mono/diheme cytochrome c family protein